MVDIVLRRCAGLDVHKAEVMACLLVVDDSGELRQEVRTYETNTRGLTALMEWLKTESVAAVAMESTGVYWKPVFNVLEGNVPNVLLVNAQHVKNVPGRKTDVKDCQWIAQLLQLGLLKPSFIPPENVRQWRDLTRSRTRLEQEKSRHANRIQKYLEDANVKLATIASDVLGVSGREIIRALISGETDENVLADLAKGRLRERLPELRSALRGRVTDHHRFMLQFELDHLEQIEASIAKLDERLGSLMCPFQEKVERLRTIPGIGPRTAQILLAEIGPDMRQFPTADHLASWAGVCPGNNLSAGKRLGRAQKKGSPWLRAALVEAAYAASRVKKSYLRAQYYRLKARRGSKRAAMAVAHSILVSVHHMLANNVDYEDLGVAYFDEIRRDRLVRHHLKRLRELGVDAAKLNEIAIPESASLTHDDPVTNKASSPRSRSARPLQRALF